MSSGEDWLLRPVMRQLVQYESLKTGLVDLADIAKLNELLDIEAINTHKLMERQKNGRI